jgi:hypothetical protein
MSDGTSLLDAARQFEYSPGTGWAQWRRSILRQFPEEKVMAHHRGVVEDRAGPENGLEDAG